MSYCRPPHRMCTQSMTSFSSIDLSAELHTRKLRPPDYQSENEALAWLADTLAEHPDHIAQELANTAMRLTQAGSAGISIEEDCNGEHQFRWIATAGALERYLNGTVPYDVSPCSQVVERNAVVLLHRPATHYRYIRELDLPVKELLLVPFHRGGRPAGTVWVVSHDEHKTFDAEDLRQVLSITKFAAIATQTVGVVNGLRDEDQRKDHFLAALSHEMRNPLSAITASTELLKHLSAATPAYRKPIDCIERQLAQLLALVNDLTDISSIKSGHVTLHREALVLQDIVTRALDSCGAALRDKQHRLIVDMPETPIRLEGDGTKLTQVLVNLLNNAVKYTPNSGLITLEARQLAQRVSLKVSDSGIGIPAELLPRIFDMFMQVALSDRPRYSGMGVGLALVYQFVQLHHGTVTAHSAGANLGSTFTVELPHQL